MLGKSAFLKTGEGILFVCGSSSQASHDFCRRCDNSGIPVLRIPFELTEGYHQNSLILIERWAQTAIQALQNHPQVVVAIDRPVGSIRILPQFLSHYLSLVAEFVL